MDRRPFQRAAWMMTASFGSATNAAVRAIIVSAMKRRLCATVAVLFVLSACSNNTKSETVTSVSPDPMAAELAKRPPVALPPMIKTEVTMRCKDNSLVYVTFFTDDTLAAIKSTKEGAPIRLTAEKSGGPFLAQGYSLTGTSSNITLVQPGKDALTCKR